MIKQINQIKKNALIVFHSLSKIWKLNIKISLLDCIISNIIKHFFERL